MAKEAWRLIFVEGLLPNFLNGKECSDLRLSLPSSNHFREGQFIEGHFLEGISILLEIVEDTKIKPLSKITPEERNAWGRGARETTTFQQMFETMRGYYQNLTAQSLMALNILRLPTIDRRPIAKFLPPDLIKK